MLVVKKNTIYPRIWDDSEAYAAAKKLGYRKIKERTRNDAAIFKKGKS
ncbi:toxin C-terminal domain-containing protein, partial [Neisseria meningitidis]